MLKIVDFKNINLLLWKQIHDMKTLSPTHFLYDKLLKPQE